MHKNYLGVDIGSISTKAVVIDEDNNIILEKYIWTEGNPVEATKKVVKELEKQIDEKKLNDQINIVGVGTTGSARKLVGSMLRCTGCKK
ncbi:MAG: CoA-substrate-specific enzyme activase [Clostridia bacterium]|jgi:activator of 2-hydroxyglutaryl-CoA dehydratase|nr:CoA-substrate-specific enzyme activase [Clostridia bacterium]